MRLRFDDKPPERQLWSESTDNEALFAPASVALARRIARSSRLRFEFVPFNSSPQVVEFDVRGLNELLPKIAKPCGWSLGPSTETPAQSSDAAQTGRIGRDRGAVTSSQAPHLSAQRVFRFHNFKPDFYGWVGWGRTKTATAYFEVAASELKFKWTHKGPGTFVLQVCDARPKVIWEVKHQGNGEGTEIVPVSPGRFYLVPMGDQWQINLPPGIEVP